MKILITLFVTLSLNTAFALPVAPFDALKKVEHNSLQADNFSNQYSYQNQGNQYDNKGSNKKK